MKVKDFDFRIWDNGKYHYMKDVTQEKAKDELVSIAHINNFSIGENDELELFTGFTDIEGNKIYEGDIVDDVIKGKPRGEPAEIVFKGGCFYRKSLKYGIDHIFTADIQEGKEQESITKIFTGFKVIGNIHENKDLLKANEKETTSKE